MIEKVQVQKSFKPEGKKVSVKETEFLKNNGLKWCSKCNTAKPFSDFSKSNSKDGLDSSCKSCKAEYRKKNKEKLKEKAKQYYSENKEYICEKASEYRSNNVDKVKKTKKQHYENNKESILEKNNNYRLANLDKIKAQQKQYHLCNLEERKKYQKEYRLKNVKILSEKRKIRYHTDIDYRMKKICREIVKRMFYSIGTTKNMKTSEVLGYTPQDLKEHIEKQFTEGMRWDNYGDWYIDHIIPISKANSFIEGLELSKLENLQPLWAEDNLIKSNN